MIEILKKYSGIVFLSRLLEAMEQARPCMLVSLKHRLNLVEAPKIQEKKKMLLMIIIEHC